MKDEMEKYKKLGLALLLILGISVLFFVLFHRRNVINFSSPLTTTINEVQDNSKVEKKLDNKSIQEKAGDDGGGSNAQGEDSKNESGGSPSDSNSCVNGNPVNIDSKGERKEVNITGEGKNSEGEVLSLRKIKLPNDSELTFVEISASNGAFIVGGLPIWDLKEVRIEKKFFISEAEITQKNFSAFFPKHEFIYEKNDMAPAENVSWVEAKKFCDELTAYLRATKQISEDEFVDLPTEYQWEYVSKCDLQALKELHKFAWFRLDSQFKPHEVATKQKNRWGIHDILGNVSEWCKDSYNRDGCCNISNQVESDIKVVKGGDFSMFYAFPSERCPLDKMVRSGCVGFRIVLNNK